LNSNGIQSENHLGGDDLWVDEWNENWDNESYQYERGVEYKMTKTGLEELRRDRDFKTMEDSDGSSSYDKQEDMSDKEIQLQKLKEEREAIKNDIKKLKEEELQKEKTRVVKVNDLKKDDIGSSNIEKMNKIGKAAGKLSDLQWVLDRFTH
jgi:seryl-tRNA synthetase